MVAEVTKIEPGFKCVSSRRMHCASTVSSRVAAMAVGAREWTLQRTQVMFELECC